MPTATITADTVLRRSQAILASGVGDEMVMMDIDAGKYYGFNAIGVRIWNLLEQDCSVKSICDQLLDEFEIESTACEQEVMAFVEQLLKFKIIAQVDV